MRFTTKLSILALLSAASLTGCKKHDDKPAPTPAAAPAAAPAPAPSPSPPGVVLKDASYKQIEGTYDGTTAIAVGDANSARVVLGLNCGPSFGCGITTQWANAIDSEKFVAACPKGVALYISVEDVKGADDPKPGKHPASMYVVEAAGPQTSIHTGDVLEVTERTADSLSGKVTYTQDQTSVNGTFKATICKPAK